MELACSSDRPCNGLWLAFVFLIILMCILLAKRLIFSCSRRSFTSSCSYSRTNAIKSKGSNFATVRVYTFSAPTCRRGAARRVDHSCYRLLLFCWSRSLLYTWQQETKHAINCSFVRFIHQLFTESRNIFLQSFGAVIGCRRTNQRENEQVWRLVKMHHKRSRVIAATSSRRNVLRHNFRRICSRAYSIERRFHRNYGPIYPLCVLYIEAACIHTYIYINTGARVQSAHQNQRFR